MASSIFSSVTQCFDMILSFRFLFFFVTNLYTMAAVDALVSPEDKVLKQRVVLSQEQAVEIYKLKVTHGFPSQHTASTKLSHRY